MRDEPIGANRSVPEGRSDLLPLGPPGWEEFEAARRRFERSMARLGAQRTSARATPAGEVSTGRDLVRGWR